MTESVAKRGKREGKRLCEEKVFGMVATAGSTCVCVCAQYDVTLMWFKGWKAEMKQSVLDRNAWLAESLLRQKHKRDKTGIRMEMKTLKRGSAWKKQQIFLNNLKTKRRERVWLRNHVLLYISKQTAAEFKIYSACTLIFSTKLTLIKSFTEYVWLFTPVYRHKSYQH